jgi:hypothetical protein
MTKHKWLPSEPKVEMIEAGMFQMPEANTDIVEAIYDAMWQAAPEVEQEPVGYIYRQSDIDRLNEIGVINTLIVTTPDTGYKVPLYTHPQPKREPLSEDEIRRLWKNGTNVETIVEFARLIEKAHGIGVSE